MRRARTYRWTRMRPYRERFKEQGVFFAFQSWAGCITNIFGFDLRQAQGSLVNTMADGSTSEVGTIGNEGIVGLPVILGDRLAPTSTYVQVPGTGLRLPADILAAELEHSNRTRTIMVHYAHAFF
jgi:hypothetical protein